MLDQTTSDMWDYSLLGYMDKISKFYAAHKDCQLVICDHRGGQVYPLEGKVTCYADDHEDIRTAARK